MCSCFLKATGSNGYAGNVRLPDEGVTLIELLTVLAIIAVMAVIALPFSLEFSSGRSLEHQAVRMATDITRARDLAMERGYDWRIFFFTASKTWISFEDRNANGSMDQGEERLGPYSLDRECDFGSLAARGPNDTDLPADGISLPDNRLVFSPMGCSKSGTIYIKDKKQSMALRMLPASGIVRIWRHRTEWEVFK